MNSSLKLIFWFADTRFFNKQHFYNQHQAEAKPLLFENYLLFYRIIIQE